MNSETDILNLGSWAPFLRFLDRLESRQNRWAGLLLLLLFLLIYLVLRFLPFPEYQQVSEIPVSPEIFDVFEIPPVEAPEPVTGEETVAAPDLPVLPTREEMDRVFSFAEVEALARGTGLLQESELLGETPDLPPVTAPVSRTGGQKTGLRDDFLMDDGDPLESLAGLSSAGSNQGVAMDEGSSLPSSGGSVSGLGVSLREGPSAATGSGVEVTLMSFDTDDYEGKKIVYPLIEWMRAHPREHEYTVRRFLGYEAGDLTSVAVFTADGRRHELYLLANGETLELSIFIVDGDRFTRLVDQGLAQKSHRLEQGRVVRDPVDQRIVNLFATQQAPSRETTDAFMNLFLSWWNKTRPDQ